MNFGDERISHVFWRNVVVNARGCWVWTRYTAKNGYGVHGRRAPHSGSALTHRYTYEFEFGALPAGTELDHFACQNRACCNPLHMEAVPHIVNVRRGKAKKTHCKRGHTLAGGNLLSTRRGTRCRICFDLHAQLRDVKRKLEHVPKPRGPRPQRTMCSKGHSLEGDNLKLTPIAGTKWTRKDCKACTRARWAKWNERNCPNPGHLDATKKDGA